MKRISLLSASLVLLISISTQARDYYYSPLKYRTHWSPYSHGLVSGLAEYNPNAFSYKSDGLVNHRLEYSPHAFSYNNNGLVDRDVEYNPYAFSYNNPGLVSRTSGDFCRPYRNDTAVSVIHRETVIYQDTSCSDYTKKTKKQTDLERKAAVEEQKARIEKRQEQKANDPSEAIREFLDSKNIRYQADRSLRIEGETVSINFNLKDADIIIKFWNSKAITEFAENDKYKKDIFDKYMESWEEYCINHIGNTKKIYNIFSHSKEDVLKQLSFDDNTNCDEMPDIALYASSQD